MNVLITGATGSIGKELTNSLLAKGYKIAVIVRDAKKAKDLFANVEIINFQEKEWATEVIKFSPAVVIHLAALLTSRDDLDIIPDLVGSNIIFGTQLLQVLRQTQVKLFINTGTFAEYFYGDGAHSSSYLYSATKTAFHAIIKYYQQLTSFKVVNVIPYTVYGQVDTQPKIIDIIYKSFLQGDAINMSGGEQTLDFIHIDDVLAFYTLLVEKSSSIVSNWEDYHLGTGRGTTLREVAQMFQAKLNLPENVNWGALPYRARDTMYSVAPIGKLINHFSWKPTVDIAFGITKFISKKQLVSSQ